MDKVLSRLFVPLPSPEEMHLWDAEAMSLGLPQELLMENAARAAFAVLKDYFPQLSGKRVVLIMGSGNNGGDAACLARLLLDVEAKPLVLHTKPLAGCKGTCGKHVRLARACGVPFRRCPSKPDGSLAIPDNIPTPDILVDGLLGTGFRGALKPQTLALVRAINVLPTPFVLALDIPSGLDGISGKPLPEAVRATATVSFQAAKPGLLQPEAAMWTGRVHVRDIGIPTKTRQEAPCSFFLADGRCLSPFAVARPGVFKNSYGHVFIIGGAAGLGGAAHLAARTALRAGCGLVTAAAPAPCLPDIKNGCAEIMTLALTPMPQSQWPETLPDNLTAMIARGASLVVGPGMGRGEDATEFLASLLDMPERPPTVFDADALALLARQPALFARVSERDILTPHPGEAALLLGCTARDIQADRLHALHALCSISHGVVVLKGSGTLVGQDRAPVLLCPYDVPQLSVGGSGDVLAGCLGGLLARVAKTETAPTGASPSLTVAGQAVALHALAGKILAEKWPLRGNMAASVADALPRALFTYALREPEGDVQPWPR
ncbi:MAG: NAD(P)H-hydrate dehydratase [Desulfovibrio sp.]|nr:NAD(P)H-hydrate dehydratase [Desulfovibrio sp.]